MLTRLGVILFCRCVEIRQGVVEHVELCHTGFLGMRDRSIGNCRRVREDMGFVEKFEVDQCEVC